MTKYTTEYFIERARKVHGDKYDYSKVVYEHSIRPVCITCPKHGEFWQTPYLHISRKMGCKECGLETVKRKLRHTTEAFIKKAKKIHGDKYDYSLVNYVNNRTPVKVICPIHGEFEQKPCVHIKSGGCPKCVIEDVRQRGMETTEVFIEKARAKHGDKYDYSLAEYDGNNKPVRIICPVHGEFSQTPHVHKAGGGCPKCAWDGTSKRSTHTKEIFIAKARKVHGDKYDYSIVVYNGDRQNVDIICPVHGVFKQTPFTHKQGAGCPKCAIETNREKQRFNTEIFIEKSTAVHGDKYDYSKVEYIGADIPVCIVCPKHGEFWQSPRSHYNGSNCPKCSYEAYGIRSRLTREQFIEISRKNHTIQYDYSQVVYNGSGDNVTIICPQHGPFEQNASSHMQGYNCPKCSIKLNALHRSKTLEKFIEDAKKVHGDKYTYEKTIYVNSSTRVVVTCTKHGDFETLPCNFLSGCGCKKCANELTSARFLKTQEEFIADARKTHGDRYNYDQVRYVNCHTLVDIVCPKHGLFQQTAGAHITGCNCPKCNRSKLEESISLLLSDNEIDYVEQATFPWLGQQRIDFYIPSANLGIECQGGQHFFPVECFGGEKVFSEIVERDTRKKRLCDENALILVYYSTPDLMEASEGCFNDKSLLLIFVQGLIKEKGG